MRGIGRRSDTPLLFAFCWLAFLEDFQHRLMNVSNKHMEANPLD
ncbi:hypothetical protein HMPREF0297_0517 [Corynebacterium jeikeium ATCC 43734]|nr:hypothetical protein HMPREF0297_0517 [Corynebacterium jeikeium ATCC 43734]